MTGGRSTATSEKIELLRGGSVVSSLAGWGC